MATKLSAQPHDLGEFRVLRILPHRDKRAVGPFVFFDHMGPATFPAGNGVNVRPHPHIGLATLTYLFEGSILHRDSLGNIQEIFPGDVNWMTAGYGIVHSERETIENRSREHRLNGLQVWLALPEEKAEIDPDFQHVKKEELPHRIEPGWTARVVAGSAWELSSPVNVHSPTCYLDIVADRGAEISLPEEHEELAVYLMAGSAVTGSSNNALEKGDFAILSSSERTVTASENLRIIVIGGKAFDQPPHLNWNFVSFDRDKITQARERWVRREFPEIPGDDREFIPLPD